jgi:single-strand DNA-binding protein
MGEDMARSVNSVTLLGNLGQDPEIRTTPTGAQVCTLNVATTESYKNRNGEWVEETEWHRVVLWEGLAENAGKNLRKGSKVYVEGKIKTRSYEKDGEKRRITEVRGLKVISLDPKTPGEAVYEDNDFSPSTGAEEDIPF